MADDKMKWMALIDKLVIMTWNTRTMWTAGKLNIEEHSDDKLDWKTSLFIGLRLHSNQVQYRILEESKHSSDSQQGYYWITTQ